MTKIQSLEARIRAKAQAKLQEELNEAAKPLNDLLTRGYALETPDLFRKQERGEGFENSTVYDALCKIKIGLFNNMIAEREEKAIQDFLDKVNDGIEHLQNRIDELKNDE